ncbi:MAG: histidinol dehydrogenase [Butyricicoccaceae bacterium]
MVEPSVLDAAYDACDPKLISALEKAAANIRDYHEQMLVKSWEWKRSAGETLGQTVRGLARVGIYVPGGTAAYPSSVLMNAIPAKVAGVGELIMVTPPTENMSNEVLAAAKIAVWTRSSPSAARGHRSADLRRDHPAGRQDRRPGQRLLVAAAKSSRSARSTST